MLYLFLPFSLLTQLTYNVRVIPFHKNVGLKHQALKLSVDTIVELALQIRQNENTKISATGRPPNSSPAQPVLKQPMQPRQSNQQPTQYQQATQYQQHLHSTTPLATHSNQQPTQYQLPTQYQQHCMYPHSTPPLATVVPPQGMQPGYSHQQMYQQPFNGSPFSAIHN